MLEHMEPLLLVGLAVAAYFYLSGSGSSGSTVQSTAPGQFGLTMTGSNASGSADWRAASPITSFAPGQIGVAYFGGGGHAEQSGGYHAPAVSNSPMPDMSHYFDKPGQIDTNPVYNPAATDPFGSQAARDKFARCTYITGETIPGCK